MVDVASGIALTELVESGLREILEATMKGGGTHTYRPHTFKGEGLQEGPQEGDWIAERTPSSEGSAGYWPVFRDLVASGGVVGPRVHDARIAAIFIRNGVDRLFSSDGDFSRFPGPRVVNPLLL
jgi:hypothetical protein